MESRSFEKIEEEFNIAVIKNNTGIISGLYKELISFEEGHINSMPETVYARYLRCIDKAKAVLNIVR